jgi:hypothetical protein
MSFLNSTDTILPKLPLANSSSVDAAPFSFETDKTGLASPMKGGKKRRTKRNRSKRRRNRKITICKSCGGIRM